MSKHDDFIRKHISIDDASVIKITNEIDKDLIPLFLRVLNAHNNGLYTDELCDEMSESNVDIDYYTGRISEELCVVVDVGPLTFRLEDDEVTMERAI